MFQTLGWEVWVGGGMGLVQDVFINRLIKPKATNVKGQHNLKNLLLCIFTLMSYYHYLRWIYGYVPDLWVGYEQQIIMWFFTILPGKLANLYLLPVSIPVMQMSRLLRIGSLQLNLVTFVSLISKTRSYGVMGISPVVRHLLLI